MKCTIPFHCYPQNIFAVVNELRNPSQKRTDNVAWASVISALVVYTVVAIAGFYT
jgi:amino acid permease